MDAFFLQVLSWFGTARVDAEHQLSSRVSRTPTAAAEGFGATLAVLHSTIQSLDASWHLDITIVTMQDIAKALQDTAWFTGVPNHPPLACSKAGDLAYVDAFFLHIKLKVGRAARVDAEDQLLEAAEGFLGQSAMSCMAQLSVKMPAAQLIPRPSLVQCRPCQNPRRSVCCVVCNLQQGLPSTLQQPGLGQVAGRHQAGTSKCPCSPLARCHPAATKLLCLSALQVPLQVNLQRVAPLLAKLDRWAGTVQLVQGRR